MKQQHQQEKQNHHTLSRSERSILPPPNSFRSRSALLKLDEYLGSVGGGIGRAAMAGFSCVLFELCMPAVIVAVGAAPVVPPGV
jgi:hypothetical protein